jgi:hypothetical protein
MGFKFTVMQQHCLGIDCDWMLGLALQAFQDPPLCKSIVYLALVPVEEVGGAAT